MTRGPKRDSIAAINRSSKNSLVIQVLLSDKALPFDPQGWCHPKKGQGLLGSSYDWGKLSWRPPGDLTSHLLSETWVTTHPQIGNANEITLSSLEYTQFIPELGICSPALRHPVSVHKDEVGNGWKKGNKLCLRPCTL